MEFNSSNSKIDIMCTGIALELQIEGIEMCNILSMQMST